MISCSLQTLCIPRRCLCLSIIVNLCWFCSCHHKARNAFGFCGLWPRDEWLLLVVLQHRVLHVLWRREMLRRRVEQTLLSQGDDRHGHGELKRGRNSFCQWKDMELLCIYMKPTFLANTGKEWIHHLLCFCWSLLVELRAVNILRWST